MNRIALIGLGEVGQALAADFARNAVTGVKAFDILFEDTESIPARCNAPVEKCHSAADAVRGCSLVVSAVTAASDEDAARVAAASISPGVYFLDLNSVSPGRKSAAADIINRAGGRYIEAAVMSPIAPRRIASPILLGGPFAERFLGDYGTLFSGARTFSIEYGGASATKMCRSVIIKGLESLLLESLVTARHYGVEQDVLASLSDLLPVGDWDKLASYMISRSMEHGARRAEEMQEAAQTVQEAGVTPLMARATAERQRSAASLRGLSAGNLPSILSAFLESQELQTNMSGRAK